MKALQKKGLMSARSTLGASQRLTTGEADYALRPSRKLSDYNRLCIPCPRKVPNEAGLRVYGKEPQEKTTLSRHPPSSDSMTQNKTWKENHPLNQYFSTGDDSSRHPQGHVAMSRVILGCRI